MSQFQIPGVYGLEGFTQEEIDGLAGLGELGAATAAAVVETRRSQIPGISAAMGMQAARVLQGLPPDRSVVDLQDFTAYHKRTIGSGGTIGAGAINFFNVPEFQGVSNLRQGQLQNSDEVAIIQSVSVLPILGTTDANTGAVTYNANTANFATVADVQTWFNAFNLLLHNTYAVIRQRNRDRWRGPLAELVTGTGVRADITQSGGGATAQALVNWVVGTTEPNQRRRLPDPILIVPDTPIVVTIEPVQAIALPTGAGLSLEVRLHGSRILPGGLNR